MSHERPSFFTSFSRAQVSSAVATGLDFAVIFIAVEALHVWYVVATALGAAVGAIVNFMMNRHWSFRANHGAVHGQALKYAIVSGMSLLLNTIGVYAFTDGLKIHYSISVVVVSTLVGFLFNFPMHRHFVFR